MSYENLLKTLDEQCQREKEEILATAKKQAEGAISAAKREVNSINKNLAEELEKRKNGPVPQKKKKTAQVATIRSTKEIFRFKMESLEKVYTEAAEAVTKLQKAKSYQDLLKRLIADAVQGIEVDLIEFLLVAKIDEKAAQEFVKELSINATVKVSTQVKSGVVLTAAGGNITIDNTLASRFERVKPLIIHKVGNILYG